MKLSYYCPAYHMYNWKGEIISYIQLKRGDHIIHTTEKGRSYHTYNWKGEIISYIQLKRGELKRGDHIIYTTEKGRSQMHTFNGVPKGFKSFWRDSRFPATNDAFYFCFYLNISCLNEYKLECENSRPRWLSWMLRPTGDQEVAGSTPA